MTSVAGDTRMAIARLVAAAGGDEVAMSAAIDEIGAEVVAEIVLTEVVSRAGPIDAPVLFRLLHKDLVSVRMIGEGDPEATVDQSLAEVAAGLFGSRGIRAAASRTLRWRDLDAPASFGKPLPAFETVRRLLDGIDRPYAPGLAELCVSHGSDKWGAHQYPRHYERHFEPIRDRQLTILEIGVGGFGDPGRGGASLRMWKRYFPRALVYGLDITDKTALSEPRLTILHGDQSSTTDLADVVATTGSLDVVIDDGSHVSAHLITAFESLFPALRDGGLYVLEDLQTSYWPSFGGKQGVYDDPATSVGFLKRLVDGLNHEEIMDRSPLATDATIGGLHFYHNLAFVEKATNLDGGAPPWIPRV